jgi:hypothetical protein
MIFQVALNYRCGLFLGFCEDPKNIFLFKVVNCDREIIISLTALIRLGSYFLKLLYTACVFDIRLYMTPLGQARQLRETCGT